MTKILAYILKVVLPTRTPELDFLSPWSQTPIWSKLNLNVVRFAVCSLEFSLPVIMKAARQNVNRSLFGYFIVFNSSRQLALYRACASQKAYVVNSNYRNDPARGRSLNHYWPFNPITTQQTKEWTSEQNNDWLHNWTDWWRLNDTR